MTRQEELGLLHGTLGTLILKTLSWGPRHGYAIARWIRETSAEELIVEDRALYLALHRLEEHGWVESEWGLSANNRRAKFYQITSAGRKQLKAEIGLLARHTEALARVLQATSGSSPV